MKFMLLIMFLDYIGVQFALAIYHSFLWTKIDELKLNLARLKATEKNLHINFDVRY